MNPNIYSVRDAVAGVYLAPVIAENDGTAKRMFKQALADPQSPVAKSPTDYTMERLGAFNRETGVIVPCSPVVICHASDFVE